MSVQQNCKENARQMDNNYSSGKREGRWFMNASAMTSFVNGEAGVTVRHFQWREGHTTAAWEINEAGIIVCLAPICGPV